MNNFAGDQKASKSLVHSPERKFIDWAVPRIPKPIMSHHLTALTLLWSIGIVAAGYFAREQLVWIHAISVFVFLQWLTDSLDGSLGKFRKQGLVKWGFFMDHFLDFLFAGSIVISYWLIADGNSDLIQLATEELGASIPSGTGLWLTLGFFLLLLITSAMMAVSFLSFAATNKFQVSYYKVGPTEIRIGYIALNTFVYFAGVGIFSWGVPLVIALNLFALVFLVAETSKNLWAIDKNADVDNA